MAEQEEIDLTSLEGQTFIIGRDGHIYIDDETVSRKHAALRIHRGKIQLKDLNSKNGTYLVKNNKMVMLEEAFVSPLQTVLIGDRKCQIADLLQIASKFFAGDDATTQLKPLSAQSRRKASNS